MFPAHPSALTWIPVSPPGSPEGPFSSENLFGAEEAGKPEGGDWERVERGAVELEGSPRKRPEGGGRNRSMGTEALPRLARPVPGLRSCAPARARLAFLGPELNHCARRERAPPSGRGVPTNHTSAGTPRSQNPVDNDAFPQRSFS